MYIHVYIYVYTYIHIYTHVNMCACVRIYVYVYTYIYTYIYMNICKSHHLHHSSEKVSLLRSIYILNIHIYNQMHANIKENIYYGSTQNTECTQKEYTECTKMH